MLKRRFHPYQTLCTNGKPVTTTNENVGNNGNGDNGNGVDGGDLLVPGWKEKHASISEAIVKAERHVNCSTDELQRKTVEHVEQVRKKKVNKSSSTSSSVNTAGNWQRFMEEKEEEKTQETISSLESSKKKI